MRVGCSILFYGKLFYLWKESSNSILIFDIVFIILFDYYYFIHSIHSNRYAFVIKIINWTKMVHQIIWSEVLKLWNSILGIILSQDSVYQSTKSIQLFKNIIKLVKNFPNFHSINKIKDESFLPKSKSRNHPRNEQYNLPLLLKYNIQDTMEERREQIVQDVV